VRLESAFHRENQAAFDAGLYPDFSKTPEAIALEKRREQATASHDAAHLAVLSTPQTTIAGIVAVLRYAMADQYYGGSNSVGRRFSGMPFIQAAKCSMLASISVT